MEEDFKKNIIQGESIYLRPVVLEDATEEYCKWLNDKEVNQFLEVRFDKYDLDTLKNYILDTIKSSATSFWAIVSKDQNKFIGTIKLGSIYWNHGFGTLSLMVGDKKSWGKGYATDAVNLLTNYAFDVLKLRKIIAGIYDKNLASIRIFQKAGYSEEARQKKQYIYRGKYVDRLLMVKFKKNEQ